jgi:hypothetical protein
MQHNNQLNVMKHYDTWHTEGCYLAQSIVFAVTVFLHIPANFSLVGSARFLSHGLLIRSNTQYSDLNVRYIHTYESLIFL